MTSTSLNIKQPPEKLLLPNQKNYSRQGKCLSHKLIINYLKPTTLNFTFRQNQKIQSIFDSITSQVLKKPIKSERKYFKSVSQAQITQTKLKFDYQNQKKKQRSLTSLLLSNKQQSNEQKNKGHLTNRYRPPSSFRLSKNSQRNTEKDEISILPKRIQTQRQQDEKKLLQSTNFSIRSYSCMNNKLYDDENIRNSIKQFKRSHNILASNRSIRQSCKDFQQIKRSDNSSTLKQQLKKKADQQQIQIRLSIKSMSKSQSGQQQGQLVQNSSQNKQYAKQQNQVASTVIQKWIHEQSRRLTSSNNACQNVQVNLSKKSSISNSVKNKSILASTYFKQNRMILKFDKRLLYNKTEVNDPCLQIKRINPILSPSKSKFNINRQQIITIGNIN